MMKWRLIHKCNMVDDSFWGQKRDTRHEVVGVFETEDQCLAAKNRVAPRMLDDPWSYSCIYSGTSE
jgi:hypothetical protein